jgi:predicted nucleic acid-binding protein
MSADRVFIDSNIFVYTVDNDNTDKQTKAKSVVADIIANRIPVISTQVLQEFYNASTTKIKVDRFLAKSIVHDLCNMEVVQVIPELIEQGIDISISVQISFWDGLIIAAAEFANCSTIISEDLNDGQIIRGVKILNPFKSLL